jgi:drug/metabolite transporter (DMT)-like permease
MTSLTRKDWLFLILLTLSWGFSWPIMKLAVQDFPPLSFRVLGMALGLPVVWLAARIQGASLAIPAGQMREIVKLTIPNMVIWHIFMILGVKMLTAGRAAILGYTMPVWATLLGLLLFRERPTRTALIGVGCAFVGALLLLSSEFEKMAGRPLGMMFALFAAACWGYGTVLMKRSKIEMPTISLTFWMLLLSTCMVAVIAAVAEHAAWRMPNRVEWAAILYNALIIFGFAHVVWFSLARKLPPFASGLSIMMIPVLGVFSGAWMLGEMPQWQDFAAMGLIIAAMSTVLLKRSTPTIHE